jgi:hypothetical protein
LVLIAGAGVGSGNDNISITGCNIYSSAIAASPFANAIYLVGTTNKENDNITIRNNNIFNFSNGGVILSTGTGNAMVIKDNHFYNNNPVLPTTALTGIQIANTFSNGDTISGNYIGGRARFCGGTSLTNTGAVAFTGIICSVGSATGVSIQGNIIQNITYSNATAGAFTGIQVTLGVANIGGVSGNTIGSTTLANSIVHAGNSLVTGIIYSGSNAVVVSNNNVANIALNNSLTAASLKGITVSTTTNGITVNNNNVNNLYTTSANIGSTNLASLVGIAISCNGSSQTINNNVISNLNNAGSSATAVKVIGLVSTLGVNNISGNQIRNLSNSNTSTGTITLASLIGLMHTSSSTGGVIANNLVDTLTQNAYGLTQTIGIYATGVSLSLTDNIVRRINTYSTSSSTLSSSAVIGIAYNGTSANINISRNTIHSIYSLNNLANSGHSLVGLYTSISTAGTNVVNRNTVHSISCNSTNPANIHGVFVNAGTTTYTNNMVRLGFDADGTPLNQGMYNIFGITLNTGSANNFYHNSVYVTNNFTQPTPPYLNTHFTAAFNQSTTAFGILNIKNNIFMNDGVNFSTGNYTTSGVHAAMKLFSTSFVTSNFNILNIGDTLDGAVYVMVGSSSLGASNLNYTFFKGFTGVGNLPSWQASNQITPFDFNSGAGNPSYSSVAGNASLGSLRLNASNPAEGAGDPSLALVVLDDFDGGLRSDSTGVDIGADAGNFTKSPDVFAPVITYTPLTNTATLANRTINVTITDNIGVSNTLGSRPTMYYKKNSNATFTAAVGTFNAGILANGTWSFSFDHTSISAGLGDTVNYFFVAQDAAQNTRVAPIFGIASDVNSIQDTPNVLSSYLISSPLPTVLNVGPSETYKCLTCAGDTGLFNAINNGFLSGNTIININGDTLIESGAVALNNWLETSGGVQGSYNYSLTIRPGTGGSNTKKLIVSDFAGSTLRFVGTDNLTLTGVGAGGNSTDTNLVIRNRNLTSGVISLTNDANRNTFTNLIVEGRSSGTNSLFTIGTTANTTGNDSLLIANSYFRADTSNTNAGNGLVSSGTVGKENDNITIQNCHFANFNQAAVFMNSGTGNNIVIRNNHIYHNSATPPSSALFLGIIFQGTTLSNNDTITGNYIGGSGPNAALPSMIAANASGVEGMRITVGSVTGVYINNNTVQNIVNNSGGVTGLNIAGGINVVSNNTIGSVNTNSLTSNANAAVVGIVSTTTSDITIQNNTIRNLFSNNVGTTVASRGIMVSNGSANFSLISGNTISNLTTQSTSSSSTISSALVGIGISSFSPSQTITNNSISNLVNTNTAVHSATAYGIFATGGLNNISSNSINGIYNPSSSASTTTFAAINGIINSSSTAAQVISSNTIINLRNFPLIPANTQVNGIMFSSSPAGVNASNNVISNLSSNSVTTGITTSSAIMGLSYNGSGINNTILGNTIHSLSLNTPNFSNTQVIGLFYQGTTTGNNLITRNTIHSIRNTSLGNGLIIGLQNNSGFGTFSNNIIRVGIDSAGIASSNQIEVRGIFHNTTIGCNYYHNTVYVGASPNAGTTPTYAFFTGSTITTGFVLNLRNNIFYNASTNLGSANGFHYAVKLNDLLRLNSNNNLFAASGSGAMLFGTLSNFNSLRGAGGWNVATGLDYNSGVTSTPFFQNATGNATLVNLRLNTNNPAEGGADASISSLVSVDIDNNSRAGLSGADIGAHAGTFSMTPDVLAPTISFATLGNTGDNIGPRTLGNVLVSDLGGVDLTGPTSARLYYKKGVNGAYSNVAASTNSGNANSATFSYSIDYTSIGGVASNDTL